MDENKPTLYLKLGLLFALFVVINAGCRRNSFRADISDIAVPLEITRFEKLLFSADPSALEDLIPLWEKESGVFFNHYCYVTGLGSTKDPDFAERLRAYVTDRYNYMIYTRTLQVFPGLEQLTAELSKAFRYYLYYFPQKPVPKIYTFISAFSQSAITDDSLLAIGLDRYLGTNEPLYDQAGIYNYLKVNMHPAKVTSDCMKYWGETEFAFNDSVNSLIANMIYQGRNLYFISAMVPDQADSLKWGYSAKDLNYLSSAEKSIWTYLIDNKLLFSTDRFTISKYILEGPFTTDFGRNTPARSAVWIGYRITEAFMTKNPSVSLKELMNIRDYLKILNQSGYNP